MLISKKYLTALVVMFFSGFAAVTFPLVMTGRNAGAHNNIRIILPAGPDHLDPCETPRSVIGPILKQNVVETLTELNYSALSLKPRLAESWEQTTPTEWVFRLRKDVSFHDGTPFNASAVVYTLNRLLDPALNCITRTKYFDGYTIRAGIIDNYTVRFVTDKPTPVLPILMTQMAISSHNTPKGQYFALPIGTGPYKFDSWNYRETVRLQRNENYWGRKPLFENVTYIWRSSSVAAAMVAAGQADLAFSIAPQDADNPKLDKVYPNSETTLFRLSTDVPPLNDIRVRKAINLAIDRKKLLGTVISDKAQLATQRIGPNVLGWNPDLAPWEYNPAKARELLRAARTDGVPVETKIRLIGRPKIFPNSITLVTEVAKMLRSVGLRTQVDFLALPLWLLEANKPYNPDRPPSMLLSMHDNNIGDAAFTMYFKYHSQGRQSDLNIPALDRLIEEAANLRGPARKETYREALRMICEDIIADVPLYHMVNWMRINPRIDFTPSIANAVELQISQIGLR